MIAKITAPVGRGATNRLDDVKTVQTLLKNNRTDPGVIDGVCGPKTIAAIIAFQKTFLPQPDGVVDPKGTTIVRLSGGAASKKDDSLTRPVLRSEIKGMNAGIRAVSNKYMTDLFGAPRKAYGVDCLPVTNAALAAAMTTCVVGNFTVRGLRPAIESLKSVMRDIANEQPAVFAALGTAGMLCCRYQRGSTTAISNHSWGTAIDLTINNVLDARGDGRVQYGLTLIAPIFNRYGWYWGAAFHTEDAMHFEGGRDLVARWAGQLGLGAGASR